MSVKHPRGFMSNVEREGAYWRQNGMLGKTTPKQRRRLKHKAHREGLTWPAR